MSLDVKGGIDYALVKNHYDADDACTLVVNGTTLLNGIPFTNAETYYVVGLMASLNDPTVIDVDRGWTSFPHGQPTIPAWLNTALTLLLPLLPAGTLRDSVQSLLSAWPAQLAAFEAKDLLFYSDQDCWIRFEGSSRVQHYIPANTYMRFHRRCLMFFVIRDTVSGTLRAWLEG